MTRSRFALLSALIVPIACHRARMPDMSDVASAYTAALRDEAMHKEGGRVVLCAAVGPTLADLSNPYRENHALLQPAIVIRTLVAAGLVSSVCQGDSAAVGTGPRCSDLRGVWIAAFSAVERAAPDTLEFIGDFGGTPKHVDSIPDMPRVGYTRWYRAVRTRAGWAIVAVRVLQLT
jgi:hypothetical protein